MKKCVYIFLLVCNLTGAKNYFHPAPVINFYVSKFCFGDTTYFTNTTTRAISYVWNVYEQDVAADSSQSIVYPGRHLIYSDTVTNLKILFPYKGKYYIELIAQNGHVVSLEMPILVDSITTAQFFYKDCESQFINLSCCYTNCKWDFGDGRTSTEQSPVHYYDSLGTYKITLTVTNGNKSSVFSDSVKIDYLNDLNGNFNFKVLKDSVFFHANDSVSGPYTTYQWAFNDGKTFTGGWADGRKVYHTYSAKDTSYAVYLLVKNLCWTSFSSHTVYVPDSSAIFGTKLYPNPTGNCLTRLESDEKKNLQKVIVINEQGEPKDNFTYTETTKGYNFNLMDLPPGVYFVSLVFTDKIVKFKIVKE